MKPAFSYYGGKQRLTHKIIPLVNEIPHTVYVEPFCGGASVLFAKPPRSVSNNHDYREVINDINDWVVTFYRVAQKQKAELLQEINATLYSQSDHRKAASILKSSVEHSDLCVAWAFYVQVQMSFSNSLFCGWGSSVKSYNPAATWENRKQNLESILSRISAVHISSEDAVKCLKRWDSPHTLFYLDPPYPETNQGHYGGYTVEDWTRLCEALDNSRSSYILSNYPQTIEPKSAQKKIEIDALCSASGKGRVGADRSTFRTEEEMGDRERTEVLWICDRSSKIRGDLTNIATKEQLALF